MATYNGEKYIREQIDSILKQLDREDEIIVSDDHSTDTTIAILKSYGDKRIKIYSNNNSSGVVGNFENALQRATGEVIFLADQDDVWMPNKVALCLEALKSHDLVLHDATIWDGESIIEESFFLQHRSCIGYMKTLVRNSYIGCCMAFNSRVKDKVLPFPKNLAIHDMYIGLCAERGMKTALIHEPLICYRRHGANVSTTSSESTLSKYAQLKYRLIMFINTLCR